MYIGYEFMYKAFELKKIFNNSFNDLESLYQKGQTRYNNNKSEVETKIKSFVKTNGNLDGDKMQANWFPQISADVFISHSHADKKLAIAFSQWLYDNFGLETFIDSCIWGYADDLLKIIDNEYCVNNYKSNGGKTYSYEKRNYSTSHVHMMLSTALSMMIDKTECIIFLNTPNSITPNDVINGDNGTTKSPWIYSEIAMTRLIRQKQIEDYREKRLTESFSTGKKIQDTTLTIEYAIDKDHLNRLTTDNLNDWYNKWLYDGKKYSDDCKIHALDKLYKITSNNKRI
jgi:hypothetical protein